MKIIFHEARSRGYAKHGWLTTHHSFSFASYYDPSKMGFGALRVLNDDVIAPGSGFGKHPHDNMEIITIPLSGSLKHEDSMGNSAVVTAGEVQVMSAGTGVVHAEYNASETEDLTLFQVWIETAKRNVAPRYDQRPYQESDLQNRFLPVVGPMGTEGVLGIYQDATVSIGRFDLGSDVIYRCRSAGHGAYCVVIEGEGVIAGEVLKKRDALAIWDTSEIHAKCRTAMFLLIIEVSLDKA